MERFKVWLGQIRGLKGEDLRRLSAAFGTAEGIYRASKLDLLSVLPNLRASRLETFMDKDLERAGKICRDCRDIGADIIGFFDPQYPDILRHISDPPILLYVKGTLPDMDRHLTIGIVGQRKATPAGLKHAADMAYAFSRSGAVVVSGMAAGIDSAAHNGALDGGSPTVAVFGTGIDGCYPASNADLKRRIIENGAVISEYPPHVVGHPGNFPQRNRIISGLSRGVLVVEGRVKSGSMVTAGMAVKQDRDLFAIPGPIESPDYEGTNGLIKQGAFAVTEPADVLSFYGYVSDSPAGKRPAVQPDKKEPEQISIAPLPEGVEGPDRDILEAVRDKIHIDDLIKIMGMDTAELMSRLTMLEIEGLLVQHPGSYYELRK